MGALPDLVLDVDGMMCQKNCATTVAEAIRTIPQVRHTVVTFATREAQIWLQNDVNPVEIIDVIESIGYDATESRKLNRSILPPILC